MHSFNLPPLHSASGSVRLPGSKSISNRMLLLAALAEGSTEIRDLLDSDDTRVMLAALVKVGVGLLCIHTATDACLVRQYQALLGTDEVRLDFRADGIRRMAEIAFAVNEKTENIGARRLYTVIEKLLEDVSFEAGNGAARQVEVDAAYVDMRLGDLAQSEDLARYVL